MTVIRVLCIPLKISDGGGMIKSDEFRFRAVCSLNKVYIEGPYISLFRKGEFIARSKVGGREV